MREKAINVETYTIFYFLSIKYDIIDKIQFRDEKDRFHSIEIKTDEEGRQYFNYNKTRQYLDCIAIY